MSLVLRIFTLTLEGSAGARYSKAMLCLRKWQFLSVAAAIGLFFGLLPEAHARRSPTYVVQRGDTLVRVAKRFHVSVDELKSVNRLRSTMIRPGTALKIPGKESEESEKGGGPSTEARSAPNAPSRVEKRRGFARASKRHQRDAEGESETSARLARAAAEEGNALEESENETSEAPAAEVRLGRGSRKAPRAPHRESAATIRARAASLGLGGKDAGLLALGERPRAEWVAAAGKGEIELPLETPVDDGRVSRGWGSGPGGYHLALDVRADPGSPVYAVERGLIVYAGNGFSGYGNFVIVVHPNGWVSAYAHNRRNLVEAGEVVERGEQIAQVGITGDAHTPHVHFILAKNGRHCDALPLFDDAMPARRAQDRRRVVADADDGLRCLYRSQRPKPKKRKKKGRKKARHAKR